MTFTAQKMKFSVQGFPQHVRANPQFSRNLFAFTKEILNNPEPGIELRANVES